MNLDGPKRLGLRAFGRLPGRFRSFLVRTLSPSFTVGTMVVVERDDGAILFTQAPYRAKWSLPGGLLDRGEEPDVAARRELHEELGIEVELLPPPVYILDVRRQLCHVVFRGRVVAGQEPVKASVEVSALHWFPADQLPPLHPHAVGALAALR